MKYSTEVLKSGILTCNNRIYTKECLEKAHTYIQKRIQEENGILLGEAEATDELFINPTKVSHRITDSNIENNSLFVKLEILTDFPHGKTIKEALKNNITFYGCPRGIGIVNNNMTVSDYELTTIDLCDKPVYKDQQPLTLYETENDERRFEKITKDIKETFNSPQGQEIIKKVNEIMKRDNCSMIEACLKFVFAYDKGEINNDNNLR